MPPRHLLLLVLPLSLSLGCAVVAAPAAGSATPRDPVAGFLSEQSVPDGLVLLPQPPEVEVPSGAERSAAAALDWKVMEESFNERGPRWEQAKADARLDSPDDVFSCALGTPITGAAAPRLYALLRRVGADASLGMRAVKNRYNRRRPFMLNGRPSCTPEDEPALRTNGSYPSGHTATGWAWALALAEVAPDHQDAILRRGFAYGESRLVCNVHWYSDTVQARLLVSTLMARLHAEPAFRDAVQAARIELADLRSLGLSPSMDCAKEAAALQGTPLFPTSRQQ